MDKRIWTITDFAVILFFLIIDYQFLTTPHTCALNSINGNILKQTVCKLPFTDRWVWCNTNAIGNVLKGIKCTNSIAPNPFNDTPVNFTLPSSVYLP